MGACVKGEDPGVLKHFSCVSDPLLGARPGWVSAGCLAPGWAEPRWELGLCVGYWVVRRLSTPVRLPHLRSRYPSSLAASLLMARLLAHIPAHADALIPTPHRRWRMHCLRACF